MTDIAGLTDAIQRGDRRRAVSLTQEAIEQTVAPQRILDAMTTAMDRVGGQFKRNECFVPEMLIAARAMKEAMVILEPLMLKAGLMPTHTAVIGTVQGDLHDIGKNLVAMLLKGANFKVVDLGTNVSPERFVQAAQDNNAQIIGLSALLTTTMSQMKATVDAVRAAHLTRTKVIIGGAPVTHTYAREIGADGYAGDAATAVELARALVAAVAA